MDNNINFIKSPVTNPIFSNSSPQKYIVLSFLEVFHSPLPLDTLLVVSISNKIFSLETTYTNIFFTDGSVSSQGKVGIGVFCPQLQLSLSRRLPDHLSVYFAEAYAILQDINHVIQQKLPTFAIVSDNYRVLSDISYGNFLSSPHPSLIHQISALLASLQTPTYSLTWLPAHFSIPPMDLADSIAKEATSLDIIESRNFTASEATLFINHWILNKWQSLWTHPTCSYQTIFDLRSNSNSLCSSRSSDTIISRLRLPGPAPGFLPP